MSTRELGRVEVLARIRSKQLRIVDASRLMGVSYRQAKRLWKRYREEGAAGLKHRSAGRRSNHARESKFRKKVLRVGAGEVRRGGGRAVWADAGCRTLGFRGRAEDRCGDVATLDAGGRIVESGAEEEAAPPSTRAQGALWGDGADGRELSPLAGGAWSRGLLDRHGRRCDEQDVGATGRARDDLGGGRWIACLDRALRSTVGALRGLEEPVQAESARRKSGCEERSP